MRKFVVSVKRNLGEESEKINSLDIRCSHAIARKYLSESNLTVDGEPLFDAREVFSNARKQIFS